MATVDARRHYDDGNFRLALDALFENLAAEPRRLGAVARFLTVAAKAGAAGLLESRSSGRADTSALARRVHDVLLASRRDMVPEKLVGDWSHIDAVLPGEALFPITCRHDGADVGSVRSIVVSETRRETSYPPPEKGSFARGVEDARALLASLCNAEQQAALRRLHWSISPDVPSNAHLEGGSAGLAAFLAFASRLLERGVPTQRAFTADVVKGSFVRPSGLEQKLRAIHRERPFVARPTTVSPSERSGEDWKVIASDAKTVLEQVFELTEHQIDVALRGVGASGPVGPSIAHREFKLAVHALLEAAGQPVNELELVGALEKWGVNREGVVERHVLNALVADGAAARGGQADRPTWQAVKGCESPDRLQRAHEAWLQSLRATANPLGALGHAAALERWPEAAELLADAARSWTGKDLKAVDDAIARQDAAKARAVLDAADASMPAVAYVRLAFACRLSGPLFAHVPGVLVSAKTAQDRLLCVQSAVENVLQTASCIATALGVSAPPELIDRPSNGRLAAHVGRLHKRQATTLAPSASLFVDALREAGWVAPQKSLDDAFVGPLNTLLHHFGGWGDLHGEDAATLDAKVGKLAVSVGDLLLAGGPLVAAHVRCDTSPRLELADGAVLGFERQLIATPLGPAFARGLYEGGTRRRFWLAGSPDVIWQDGDDGCEGPTFTTLARSRVPVDRLPTPLARTYAALSSLNGPDASNLLRLAALDLSVSFLLRLAFFGAWRRHPSDFPEADLEDLFCRPHKHKLLTTAVALARTDAESSAAFLSEPETLRNATALVAWLERLEHLPGPLPGAEAFAGPMAALDQLLLRSPWCAGTDRLVQQGGDGRVELHGFMDVAIDGPVWLERDGRLLLDYGALLRTGGTRLMLLESVKPKGRKGAFEATLMAPASPSRGKGVKGLLHEEKHPIGLDELSAVSVGVRS